MCRGEVFKVHQSSSLTFTTVYTCLHSIPNKIELTRSRSNDKNEIKSLNANYAYYNGSEKNI